MNLNEIAENLKSLIGIKPQKPFFPAPSGRAKVCCIDSDTINIRSANDLKRIAKELPGAEVHGNSLDLAGNILSGKKLKGDGGQSEKQEPLLIISLPGVRIVNGFFKDVKDGLRIDAEDVTIERIHWMDVGEDAVNNKRGAYGSRIIGCSFDTSKKDNDKSIQLNEGRNALVKNCTIYGGITGIRLGDEHSNSNDEALVTGVSFIGCRTAMNLATIKVTVKGCSYRGVIKRVVHSLGSRADGV